MMLEVLKNVAINRLERFDNNFSIQLSCVFMEFLIDEINYNILPSEKQQRKDKNSNQFKYSIFGKEWIIINRSYPDNTNDEDVEIEIYNFICK